MKILTHSTKSSSWLNQDSWLQNLWLAVFRQWWGWAAIAIPVTLVAPAIAQPIPDPIPPTRPTPPPAAPLPPPDQLFQLPTPVRPDLPTPSEIPGSITVSQFKVVGSTVFSDQELATITATFLNRSISFAELLQAVGAITQLYTDRGYVTSGAFLPADQTFTADNAIITIQVLEGRLEEIRVSGNRRLHPGYIQSRLAVAAGTPLNVNHLLEGLQLLQLNPLLQTISAELATGTTPGKSVLNVTIGEADSFASAIRLDNNRTPSVGDFRRQLQLTESNLLGLGDELAIGYTNTDGSNALDGSYTLPLSPYNTTLRLAFNTSSSNVIERPFNVLDITAGSRNYEVSLRQPFIQTPSQDFAVGLTFNHRQSETTLLGFPFALSSGADSLGRTRVSAFRFFQEFTQRSSQDVFALRSQFSLGVGLLDATRNASPPDGQFFAWRGQGQYVRLLAPDTLLVLRSDIQLADRALPSLEQFALGGQETIRGYRQDALLSDNGILLTGEARFPVLRVSEVGGILHVVPFLDFGTTWNSSGRAAPNPATLVSGGVGLLWRQSDYLTIRLDYGIPFVAISGNKNTLQENGFYFSIVITPF